MLPKPFSSEIGHDLAFNVAKEDNHAPDPCSRRPPSMAAMLAVLESARKIDKSFVSVITWYRDVAIDELDGRTARELVADGRAGEVIEFLRAIGQGMRD